MTLLIYQTVEGVICFGCIWVCLSPDPKRYHERLVVLFCAAHRTVSILFKPLDCTRFVEYMSTLEQEHLLILLMVITLETDRTVIYRAQISDDYLLNLTKLINS